METFKNIKIIIKTIDNHSYDMFISTDKKVQDLKHMIFQVLKSLFIYLKLESIHYNK